MRFPMSFWRVPPLVIEISMFHFQTFSENAILFGSATPTVTDAVTMSVSGVPVSCFTGLYVIPSYSYVPKRIGCPLFPPYMGGTRENE